MVGIFRAILLSTIVDHSTDLQMNTCSPAPKCKASSSRVVRSPYFSAPLSRRTRGKTTDTVASIFFSPSHTRMAACANFSRPQASGDITSELSGMTEDYYNLLRHPGFRNFSHDFLDAFEQLYFAKPILIQEYVAHDPWKVLCAVTLLNKTSGLKAVPVFFSLMNIWPTPQAFAEAPMGIVEGIIRDLGLGSVRSVRLIKLSEIYINDPPKLDTPRESRCKTTVYKSAVENGIASIYAEERRYPPTPVSHLPGCGAYALDSWRIFCAGGDEWKSVMPMDKELKKYLRWKWAYEELRRWDPFLGPGDTIDLKYVRDLTAELSQGTRCLADN